MLEADESYSGPCSQNHRIAGVWQLHASFASSVNRLLVCSMHIEQTVKTIKLTTVSTGHQ
jgi:hypothetical protein